MIRLENNNTVNGSSEDKNLAGVKALFDVLPKSNANLQVIIKNTVPEQMMTEIAIPLDDKTLTLQLKLPDAISLFDKAFFKIDHKNGTITFSVEGKPQLTDLKITLANNMSRLLKADFAVKNMKIIQSSSVIDYDDMPQTVNIKPVEILSSHMVGRRFEAFILKDVPADTQKNLTAEAKSYIAVAKLDKADGINSKLIIEITNIRPPTVEKNGVTEPATAKAGLISADDLDGILGQKVLVTTDTAESASASLVLKKTDAAGNTVANQTENEQPSVLTKDTAATTLAGKTTTPTAALPSFDKTNTVISGIVISKPHDVSQKILISDIGIITVPDLKEKLPFKSIIELQIKDIISPEKLSDEYTSAISKPYAGSEKIIHHLAKTDTELLKEFTSKLPSFDRHLLTKTIKCIKAVNNRNPYEIFDRDLLAKVENSLGDKKFLIEMLKKDFTQPLIMAAQNPNNPFSMYVIPLLDGDNISQMWLYLFKPQEEKTENASEEREKEKKGRLKQRFMLDLSLSELGEMQFEGLLDNENRKMDMQIKSDREFNADEKKELNDVYVNAMLTLDYIGELKFKVQEKIIRPYEKENRRGGYYA